MDIAKALIKSEPNLYFAAYIIGTTLLLSMWGCRQDSAQDTPIIYEHEEPSEFYTGERCYITELYNKEYDEAISIAQARVEKGVTTELHLLKNLTERYIILSGSGLVEVGNLKPQNVNAGDVIHIPAGVTQRITNTGDTDLIFLAVCTPRFTPSSYLKAE